MYMCNPLLPQKVRDLEAWARKWLKLSEKKEKEKLFISYTTPVTHKMVHIKGLPEFRAWLVLPLVESADMP